MGNSRLEVADRDADAFRPEIECENRSGSRVRSEG